MALRIDLFLSLTGVFKTRSVAGKACRTGHVTLNGRRAKPSMEVRQGNVIGSVRPDATPLTVRVLAVPASKQVSKKDRMLYISYTEPNLGEPC